MNKWKYLVLSLFFCLLGFGMLPVKASASVSCSYGMAGIAYGVTCTGVNTANNYAIYDNSLNLLGTNNLSDGYFVLVPEIFEYFDPNNAGILEDPSSTLRYFTLGDDIWYSFSGLILGSENPNFTINLIDNPFGDESGLSVSSALDIGKDFMYLIGDMIYGIISYVLGFAISLYALRLVVRKAWGYFNGL